MLPNELPENKELVLEPKKKEDKFDIANVWPVWGSRKNPTEQPQYEPIRNKEQGTALGAFFRVSHKPGSKGWLGKLGYRALVGSETTDMLRHSRVRRGCAQESVLEKIASDLFMCLSNHTYKIPKTRLAELPVRNPFTQNNLLADAILDEINRGRKDERIEESVYVMSKYQEDYHDLKELSGCVLDGEILMFEDCLKRGKLPEEVEWNGTRIPIVGLMELMAVARLLADTDVLGGEACNAGFVIEQNQAGEPICVRIVKVDPGFSFNFEGPENQYYQSCNSHNKDDNNLLRADKKNLQYANNAQSLAWSNLTEKQKKEFSIALILANNWIQTQRELFNHIFDRPGFQQTPKQRSLAEINLSGYKAELQAYVKQQIEVYKIEITRLETLQRFLKTYKVAEPIYSEEELFERYPEIVCIDWIKNKNIKKLKQSFEQNDMAERIKDRVLASSKESALHLLAKGPIFFLDAVEKEKETDYVGAIKKLIQVGAPLANRLQTKQVAIISEKVDITFMGGPTPLYLAAKYGFYQGFVAIAEALQAQGVLRQVLLQRDKEGNNLLLIAAGGVLGNYRLDDLKTRYQQATESVVNALTDNYVNIIEYVFKQLTYFEHKNHAGKTALLLAIEKSREPVLVNCFLDKGCRLDATDMMGNNVFHSILSGQIKTKALLEMILRNPTVREKAPIWLNQKNKHYMTPFHFYLQKLKDYFRQRAQMGDIGILDDDFETRAHTLLLLINHKVEFAIRDEYLQNPLHIVLSMIIKHFNIVKKLQHSFNEEIIDKNPHLLFQPDYTFDTPLDLLLDEYQHANPEEITAYQEFFTRLTKAKMLTNISKREISDIRAIKSAIDNKVIESEKYHLIKQLHNYAVSELHFTVNFLILKEEAEAQTFLAIEQYYAFYRHTYLPFFEGQRAAPPIKTRKEVAADINRLAECILDMRKQLVEHVRFQNDFNSHLSTVPPEWQQKNLVQKVQWSNLAARITQYQLAFYEEILTRAQNCLTLGKQRELLAALHLTTPEMAEYQTAYETTNREVEKLLRLPGAMIEEIPPDNEVEKPLNIHRMKGKN